MAGALNLSCGDDVLIAVIGGSSLVSGLSHWDAISWYVFMGRVVTVLDSVW